MKAAAIVMSVLGLFAGLSADAAQVGASDLTTVLANDDAVGRLRELEPYIKSLRPEEVPAALKQAIAGHGPGRDDAIAVLGGRWVDLDTPAALTFSRQTDDRQAKEAIVDAYYGALAERDPEGALAEANRAGTNEREQAVWLIAHKIGLRDQQRANDLIATIHAAKKEDSDYFIFWNWAGTNLGQATEALMQKAKTAGHSYPCELAAWAMADRLLEDDPKIATSWVLQLPSGKVRDEAFDRLVSDWSKVDFDAAAGWLKSLSKSEKASNEISAVSQNSSLGPFTPIKVDPSFSSKADKLDKILWESNSWRELELLLPFVDGLSAADFPQAFEHMRNTPDSNRNKVIDVLVARWFEVDPTAAMQAVQQARVIHDMEFARQFLVDVYDAWSRHDPDAAFASASLAPNGYENWEALRVVCAALARRDPIEAHAALLKLNNSDTEELIVPVFAEWATRNLRAATKALANEAHVNGAIEGIVVGLMRQEPAVAIAWAEHLPNKVHRNRALWDVALRWPDNPAAAMAWLEKSPDFDGKNSAFEDVAVDWVNRNEIEALHYALMLRAGKEQDELLYWGLAQLTYDDADAAARFARQLPGDEMKKHALATVLAYWDEYDPTAAANYLSSVANEATPMEMADCADALSDRDPVATVRWLDKFPASADKARAISEIAKNWYRADSSAATYWVNQMPAGPLYDAGAKGICTALDGNLPPALKWARSIHDPKIRHDRVYGAFEAGTYPMRGAYAYSPGTKNEIQGAPELTDADKKALIARLPTLQVFRYPQIFKKPTLSPDH